MTENNGIKKKLVWPWLAGFGMVALLIYLIGFRDQEETVAKNLVTEDLINLKENNLIVAAFVRFMEEDTMKMELDDTFTKEALLKLVDATDAMAGDIHFDMSRDMVKIIKHVNRTLAVPIESAYADNLRDAADRLTSVLKKMQQASYPGLTRELAELENASASLNWKVLTLDQKGAVKAFFKKAMNLLRKMN